MQLVDLFWIYYHWNTIRFSQNDLPTCTFTIWVLSLCLVDYLSLIVNDRYAERPRIWQDVLHIDWNCRGWFGLCSTFGDLTFFGIWVTAGIVLIFVADHRHSKRPLLRVDMLHVDLELGAGKRLIIVEALFVLGLLGLGASGSSNWFNHFYYYCSLILTLIYR